MKIISNEKLPLALNTAILHDSKIKLTALVKQDAFASEPHILILQVPLGKHSKILPLSPTLINNLSSK